MDFEEIMLKKEKQIATITLNRPQKKKALTYRMTAEILAAIDEVGRDHDIRVEPCCYIARYNQRCRNEHPRVDQQSPHKTVIVLTNNADV
jgi:hypothetical protein